MRWAAARGSRSSFRPGWKPRDTPRGAPRPAAQAGARGCAGLGGRRARRGSGGGWRLRELTALIIEIESRCTYWVAASTLGQLGALGGRRLPRRRGPALRWSYRGWTSAVAGGADLMAVVRGASSGRTLCVGAVSGASLPRMISRRLDELAVSGIGIGRMRSGTAAMLGAAWAVEVLGAPRITASQLAALREQFASAPGCGWCGLPVVGTHCRRCSPGAP